MQYIYKYMTDVKRNRISIDYIDREGACILIQETHALSDLHIAQKIYSILCNLFWK